jgi:hypothetical protein
MPVRLVLMLVLSACAAPTHVPAPPPGPGSKAPRSDPAEAKPAPKKRQPKKVEPKETLGQCLARKGVRLYGASWCKPCHDQLSWFGDDAKNVPYTDCYPEGDTVISVPACEAVGLDIIGPYPTWIMPDGLKVVGTRSLQWLATSTDCPLRIK